MNDSSRRIRKLVGIVLILCLPVCLGIAGKFAFSVPVLFAGRTTIKLNFPSEDAPQLEAALAWAKQQVPTKFPTGDFSTNATVDQTGTPGQYIITALHEDALRAAESANVLSLQIRDFLSEKVRQADAAKVSAAEAAGRSGEDGKATTEVSEVERHLRVDLLSPATPSKEPSREKFDQIMMVGAAVGFALCTVGVILVVTARLPSVPSVPLPPEVDSEPPKTTHRRRRKNRYDY